MQVQTQTNRLQDYMRRIVAVDAILLAFGTGSVCLVSWPDQPDSRVERVSLGALGSIEVPVGWVVNNGLIANCDRALCQASSRSIYSNALEVCSQYCDVPSQNAPEQVGIGPMECTISKEYLNWSHTAMTSFVVRATVNEQVVFFIIRLKGRQEELPEFWKQRIQSFKPSLK